jgi:transposase
MGAPIVDDELWALIEPLLPTPKPRRKKYPGRLPVANRAALNGILFVLKTGIRWRDLSTKLGFGSGSTCWRRLRDWQKAGVWKRLHELLPFHRFAAYVAGRFTNPRSSTQTVAATPRRIAKNFASATSSQ